MKVVLPSDPVIYELSEKLRSENAVKQAEWFLHCCKETEDGKGWTIIAIKDERPVGFISVLYKASYPPFAEKKIPEIHGMTVLPSMRRQGIASSLLEKMEKHVQSLGYAVIGLGVGITSDYQDAFRLYIRAGYLPDGRGLYHADLPHSHARYNDMITINTSTTLWFVKAVL